MFRSFIFSSCTVLFCLNPVFLLYITTLNEMSCFFSHGAFTAQLVFLNVWMQDCFTENVNRLQKLVSEKIFTCHVSPNHLSAALHVPLSSMNSWFEQFCVTVFQFTSTAHFLLQSSLFPFRSSWLHYTGTLVPTVFLVHTSCASFLVQIFLVQTGSDQHFVQIFLRGYIFIDVCIINFLKLLQSRLETRQLFLFVSRDDVYFTSTFLHRLFERFLHSIDCQYFDENILLLSNILHFFHTN